MGLGVALNRNLVVPTRRPGCFAQDILDLRHQVDWYRYDSYRYQFSSGGVRLPLRPYRGPLIYPRNSQIVKASLFGP